MYENLNTVSFAHQKLIPIVEISKIIKYDLHSLAPPDPRGQKWPKYRNKIRNWGMKLKMCIQANFYTRNSFIAMNFEDCQYFNTCCDVTANPGGGQNAPIIFGVPVTAQQVSKYWQWSKFIVINEFLLQKLAWMYIFSFIPLFLILFLYWGNFWPLESGGGHILWIWKFRQLELISDEQMKLCSNFHTKRTTQSKMVACLPIIVLYSEFV